MFRQEHFPEKNGDKKHERIPEYKKMAGWALTSAICVAIYLYAYSPARWLTPSRSLLPPAANLWRPFFVISLIGSAGAYPIQAGGIVLGIALCAFYLYVWKRAYFHSNPRVGYAVLFLILTTLGLTGFRSNFVLATSVSSRYTIYSTLLLIFAWFAVVEIRLSFDARPPWRNPLFLGAVVCSIFFSLAMDVWGAHYLERRNRDLITGMTLYARDPSPQAESGPVFPPPTLPENQAYNRRVREILRESAQLRIYLPPSSNKASF